MASLKTLKFTGHLPASIAAPKPKRNFYGSSLNEYSEIQTFSLNFQGILYYIIFTLFLKNLIYIEERNPRKRGLKIGIFGIQRYLGSQFWVKTGNPILKFRLFSLNFQDILYYIIYAIFLNIVFI